MSTTVADDKAVSTPVARSAKQAVIADEFYSLAHWLRTGGDETRRAATSVGITSCRPRAGVSTVTWNIAAAAAQSSHENLLLLDLSSADAGSSPGLLADGAGQPPAGQRNLGQWSLRHDSAVTRRPSQAARQTGIENLLQLTLTDAAGFQAYGSDWNLIDELLRSLQEDFSFVVVDLPTTESSLCFASAGLLNGVLLVMEAERTHCEAAARAKQRLGQAHATVLGIVLNKHNTHLPKWLDARI